MKTHTPIVIYAIVLAIGGIPELSVADEAKPASNRVLAAPFFPDSFDDRSSDKGELQTDLGPAKYQDMIAEHDGMTLSLRRFMVPSKTWDLKSAKDMLDNARDNMLRGDKALKLKSEKDFTIDGFPGRSFIFTGEGDGSVMRIDYFLLKPDVFIYYYSGPQAGLAAEDVVKFFKSIKTMEGKPKDKKGEPGADDLKSTEGADGFIRQVVQSLLDQEGNITFGVADKVFAIDTGEELSKEGLKKAWPEFARRALKKKVSVEQFFRDIQLQVTSPLENKRLMSNKRVLAVYKPQNGDLCCDASHVKEGVDNFIGYDKAFIYILRKVDGKWTLIGIGG